MFDLTGKKVLITGATGGIGMALVEAFTKLNANIFATSTSEDKIKALQEKYPNIKGHVVNLSDTSAVENVCKVANEQMGGLDILICNAGVTKDTLAMRMTEADWDLVLDINLKSNFILNREAGKIMMKNKYGRVINIASVVGFMGNVGQANYVASKAGLVGMTKVFAIEFAARNVTYNTIAPGFIETNMTDKIPDNIKDEIKRKIPMARQGKPSEIASAAVFLASDEASYVTGTTIHVNGGMYCG